MSVAAAPSRMMVETILESSQDFYGMSNGSLPQWKRELLQRRAARARPAAAPPPPPPPPPPAPAPAPPDDDEELRYGPGIVKRLKSRYLSLALRDAPRRRPSVLRRAASLEHMLEQPAAPPAPPAPHPAAPAPRRDAVKRARSVDALSRLDEPRAAPRPAPPPARAPRPPRRPQPLLRDAERPPADVVRAALRKFEPAPRRAVRGRAGAGARCSTPELARPGSPADLDVSAIAPPRRAALPPPRAPRRVGVIRPMPAPPLDRSASCEPAPSPPPDADKERRATPPAALVEPVPRTPPPPPPPLDPHPRSDTAVKPEIAPKPEFSSKPERSPKLEPSPERERKTAIDPPTEAEIVSKSESKTETDHSISIVESTKKPSYKIDLKPKAESKPSAIFPEGKALTNGHSEVGGRCWWQEARGGSPPPRGARGARGARGPAAATSVVFNFVSRAAVPDYIENDGVLLRAARRPAYKASEPGVVVLEARRGAGGGGGGGSDSDGEGEGGAARPVSPLAVTFVNDNVLINGKSSLLARTNKDRLHKLKLQFDESLTRTHEYPSEASLCESPPPSPSPARARSPSSPSSPPPPPPSSCPEPTVHQHPQAQPLHNNTHMASAALSSYLPHKSSHDAFQLGVAPAPRASSMLNGDTVDCGDAAAEEAGEGDAGAAAGEGEGGEARTWADARRVAADLLFLPAGCDNFD